MYVLSWGLILNTKPTFHSASSSACAVLWPTGSGYITHVCLGSLAHQIRHLSASKMRYIYICIFNNLNHRLYI